MLTKGNEAGKLPGRVQLDFDGSAEDILGHGAADHEVIDEEERRALDMELLSVLNILVDDLLNLLGTW